jgi:Protein of unknown function (DUF3309)
MLGTILLVVLLLALLGAFPRQGAYSANWGYYPSSGIGLAVIVVIVLLLMGGI